MLSLKSEYALRAIYALSKEDGRIGREQISEAQKIPIHYLERVLISLKGAGIIRSIKGPGGGYELLRSINEITLWDLYKAVEYRETEGVKCFPSLKHPCEYLEDCEIKLVWFRWNEVVKLNMQNLTIGNAITGARVI